MNTAVKKILSSMVSSLGFGFILGITVASLIDIALDVAKKLEEDA